MVNPILHQPASKVLKKPIAKYLILREGDSELLFSIDELFDANGFLERRKLFNLFGRKFMERVSGDENQLSDREREILKLLIAAKNKQEFIDKLKIINTIRTNQEKLNTVTIDVK